MRRPRRVKAIVALSAMAAVMVAAVVWLVFQHVPAWYQPHWLTRAETQRVQREFDAIFDRITRQLAAGQPFTVSLTARQLNDALAARTRLWPGAGAWLPETLSGPHLLVEAASMRFGMRHRRGSVQSVINARVTPRVDQESLTLEIDEVRGGSLPLPSGWAGRRLSAGTDSGGLPAALQRALSTPECVSLPNRFRWPNGDIPFTVDSIDLSGGELILLVRPGIWTRDP